MHWNEPIYLLNMLKENSKVEYQKWYNQNHQNYSQLGEKLVSIITELITNANIPCHNISNRTKSLSSYLKKIEYGQYKNPNDEITDLCGVRIITYVESDIEKVVKLINKTIKVDPIKSSDRSSLLGTDKLGYRSYHIVGEFNSSRLRLPEFRLYKEMKFEIQVRTILQHAWAEISHDRSYKFAGKLPDEFSRRLMVLSGILELADKEFNELASGIDQYSKDVLSGVSVDSINTTSLKSFFKSKFKRLYKLGLSEIFRNEKHESEILTEMDRFGLKNLSDIDSIIPRGFESNVIKIYDKSNLKSSNYGGLLRKLMIIKNADLYFTSSWTRNWSLYSKDDEILFRKYKIDLESLSDEYNIGFLLDN